MPETAKLGTIPKEHIISVEFFSKKGNREESLINADGSVEPLDGRSRWFTYSFVKPVFLTKIEVKTDGYHEFDRFEVHVEHVDGSFHEERIPATAGVVTLRLGKLCNGFKFKPDRRYFSNPKLLSVITTGFTEDEFYEFEWAIKDYEENSARLTQRELRLAALTEKVTELRAERSELEAAIGRASAESDQLQKSIDASNTQRLKLESEIKNVESGISQSSAQLSEVKSELARDTAKRDALTRELRLFPSEISGFVREGNRSIRWYLGIGTPFSIILAIITYKLFSNAVDLTQLYKAGEEIDIWTIFWTRLPFVLIAITIIETCGYIVARLIFEIMRINRQRIEFAKLSIIAKDVSTAAATVSGEIAEDEIFQHETKLKMELLREHMKNYVGTEFEYHGTGIIAAIKGVAERFGKG